MPDEGKRAPVRGVVAVIEREGRLLVIRRAEGIVAGGFWCFPGGAVEPGERDRDAAAREVWEEVGLTVRPVREIWSWTRPDGGLELSWWLAELDPVDQEPCCFPAEVAEAQWLTPEAVSTRGPILESNLAFLEHYARCR